MDNTTRREFLRKAGLASVGAMTVFIAPKITTVYAKDPYSVITGVTPTPETNPTPTTEPTATTTPRPTTTPTPGSEPGDIVQQVGPPTTYYYTWNTDGCYYRIYHGTRKKVVCSPGGPGTYNFPEGWTLPEWTP